MGRQELNADANGDRQCTEAYTERLGRVIKDDIQSLTIAPKRVRIIDFCTGTGCIPLLLLSLLTKSLPDIQPDVSGIDISPTALKLATKNYHRNISRFGDEASKRQVHTRLGSPKGEAMDGPHSSAPSIIFEHANLLNVKAKISEANAGRMGVGESDDVFTIITCNPPYISKAAFAQQTERSVRNYEPKLALTPHVDSTKFTRPKLAMAMAPNVDIIEFSKPRVALSPDMEPEDLAEMVFNWVRVEDVFYVAVAERAMKLAARVMLLEVGSTEQACRVAQQVIDRSKSMYGDGFMMAPSSYWEVVEIWGDEPDAEVEEVLGVDKEEREELEETFGVKFRGKGVGRSIYFRRFEKPYELVDSGIDFVDLREDLEERKERLYWERKEVEDRRKEAEVMLEGTKE